jgi:uncharacterized protein (TIGR02246 family)
MNHLTLCLLLVLPAACARTPVSSAQPTTRPWADLAITHVNVIDVTDGSVRPDQTVLISGNRVAALGPSHDVRLPDGAEMIDARGGYLIPGLWDMHAHAASEGRVESFFRLLLANGVTGFRDPFGSREVADRARAAIAAGELPGPPRIIVAGNLVDGPPGSVPGARFAATPEDGRRLVDSLHAAGAPFIKVYFQLAPETYFAIAERSRELGVPFVGHVPMFVRAANASDAGQGSIEHLTGVLTGCSTDEKAVLVDWQRLMGLLTDGDVASFTQQYMEPVRRALATQDEARCRRLAERFVANGTWQVPTLVSLRGKAYLRKMAAADDPRTRYFTPPSRWTGESPFAFPMTEAQWEILQAQYEREKEVVGMMASAGVAFLAGSDTPTPWAFPGFGLHDELELLVEAGLTPLQALQAATLNPARFFGLLDDLGTIAEGKLADVVLLDANPLDDIRNTRRIRAVVVNGRLLDGVAIDRMLADVERARAAPDATRGQPTGAHLDTQTLEPGTRVYDVIYADGAVGRYVHTLARDSVDRREVFVVRRSHMIDYETVRQQAIFDARTFEPVRSWSSGGITLDFTFRDGRVTGTTRRPGGEPRTIDLRVPPGTLLPWMFETAVMALPLRPGYEADLGIVTYDGALDTLILRVTGATTLAVPAGEIDVYEIEVSRASSLTLWVRRQSPHIVVREVLPGLAPSLRLAQVVPSSGSDAAESLAFLPPYHVAGATAHEDSAAIAAVIGALAQGWARGDVAAVAAVYSADAEWTTVSGVVLRGAPEIREYLEWHFGQTTPDTSSEEGMAYRRLSTRYLNRDAAVVHDVTTTRRDAARAVSGPGVRRVHNTLVLARQPDGSWKIVHHMAMRSVS